MEQNTVTIVINGFYISTTVLLENQFLIFSSHQWSEPSPLIPMWPPRSNKFFRKFSEIFRKDPSGSIFFFDILSKTDRGPKPRVSKKLIKIFFEPKGHFRTFFRKKNLSTIMNGQFHVDPENLSPWPKGLRLNGVKRSFGARITLVMSC